MSASGQGQSVYLNTPGRLVPAKGGRCRVAAESATTRRRPIQLLQRAAQFASWRVYRVNDDRGTALLNGCDQVGNTAGREV